MQANATDVLGPFNGCLSPLRDDNANLVGDLRHGSFATHYSIGDELTAGRITARIWK
jgi:hypothetical protein